MYGMLGSMGPHRFIYIRQLPGVSVLRPMALSLVYLPFGSFKFTTEHMRALRCPFGNDYFNKGGALQVYGTL